MFTLTVSLDSLSMYIVAADVLILLSYILFIFNKKRKLQRATDRITDFIREYFLNTGVEVQVNCFKLQDSQHFVAIIESAPLKRFRFSNVLESNLITHILSITGNVVEKIYWRFPVQLQKNPLLEEGKHVLESDDDYFSEVHTLTKAEYSVAEVSWSEFDAQKKVESITEKTSQT